MEYLDGRTLKEVIVSEGRLSLDRAVNIVRQVAGALDAAHCAGCDSSRFEKRKHHAREHDGDEWAKVLDFGIAKICQPHGLLNQTSRTRISSLAPAVHVAGAVFPVRRARRAV
jgi:serine/threonine-protein kinase